MGVCGSKNSSLERRLNAVERGSVSIEIAQLRHENEELRKKLESRDTEPVSYLDLNRLDDHVATYLASDANNEWVPDSIEGRAVRTIYTSALGSVKSVVESTRVEFLGHEIRMVMKPAKRDE